MKRFIVLLCSAVMCFNICAFAENEVETDAKSVILMEASTGNILYEENPDEQLPIASVTKVMTMLLIMEAVDNGTITLDDMVSVSENAMSYGGSTMFLEAGEQLSVNDMLKGIAVASANDGCVAMAEHLCGSETAFVEKMNSRAKELGMENTNFMNTNGLDEDNHFSSARDVAIMSRELIKHKKIFDYTSIWTDELRGGKFKLANTNKLVRFYDGANGLKTGSTSKALCCLSATALRNDMQLVAVVLGAPTSAKRFASARALLDYGFASYKINYMAKQGEAYENVKIEKGVEEYAEAIYANDCSKLMQKSQPSEYESEFICEDNLKAPIASGQKLGEVKFTQNGEEIGRVDVVAKNDIARKGIFAIIGDFFARLAGINKA